VSDVVASSGVWLCNIFCYFSHRYYHRSLSREPTKCIDELPNRVGNIVHFEHYCFYSILTFRLHYYCIYLFSRYTQDMTYAGRSTMDKKRKGYKRGDTILIDKPFVHALKSTFKNERCDYCYSE